MTMLELHGRITEQGTLEVELPAGLEPGHVVVRIESMRIDPVAAWTDEEIKAMMRHVPKTGAEVGAWLDTRPLSDAWAAVKDEDVAKYTHDMRRKNPGWDKQ